MIVPLAQATMGALEILVENLSALVEQTSLLVTCTVGGCRVILKGKCVAERAIRADFMHSEAL